MKRLDDCRERYLKVLVYGASGSGKTSLGVSAPRPLVLLSERQGMQSVRDAATRLGVPQPEVLYMEDLQDYRNVARALHRGPRDGRIVVTSADAAGESVTYEGPWPETVVVDSVTDAMALVEDEIERIAPSQPGRDGLPVRSERFWDALRDRTEKLFRAFRDAPANVIFLAGVDERVVGEGNDAVRTVNPDMPMRKFPEKLARAVNLVGMSVRRIKAAKDDSGQRVIEWVVLTALPTGYLSKPLRPLLDEEVPDFSSWVQRVITRDPEPTRETETKKSARSASKEQRA